ncbi:MAG: sulfotransferase domain-containing protein [Nocardioidaceae bacterium]
MRHYRSDDDDSARWQGFPFREGDIVISTRSKSGTTWMQMVCALLVLGTPDLPRPLSELSPWVDHAIEPVQDVFARLEAQPHRRFVKTHTPLDGIPLDERATYVVVGRHPLDLAVSLYHQGDNIDRQRLAELTGVPARPAAARPPVHDWLVRWTLDETTALEQPDSLVGVLHHLTDAWSRSATADNIVLVHYADLLTDLPGEMQRLADRLGITVAACGISDLAEAATFARMRARSGEVTPDTLGVLKDSAAFFRAGRSGSGRELLTPDELAAYEQRVARLAPPEVLTWLHR